MAFRDHKIFYVTFVLLLSFISSAEAMDEDTNLLVFEDKPAREAVVETENLEIKLDPSEVKESVKDFDREAFIREARDNMNREPSKEQIEIWNGPRNENDLVKVLQLNDSEIASFLAKKNAFLNKFAKSLAFFRLSPGKINKALLELNNRFYESSHTVSRSNTKMGTVMFSLSGGLALPKKMVEAMNNRGLGGYVPKSGGFVYLLGFGASFGRKVDSTGKGKFVFELFMDVERLKSTLTGVAEVSAAGTYGLVFEQRPDKFATQKNSVTYGGVTGVFRQGPNQFGWAASTGMSFPPGIGAILVFQNEATRFYLFRSEGLKATLPALAMVKTNVLSYFRNLLGGKNQIVNCSHVF
ncbi:hypothetical protein AZI85_00585 [Bdellovibrio bacteriovorus]|uniref:Uncharacterized protein n=1 Tax=Bdellovibrio bacteriovorus TaxID=959 RepID=A0A150WVD3_BDEBC|nr:hypothetical protein [Bdellovibrio bacteriovorus]KYG70478.1 hypothetical protein AZI85_00585 [Bdellovibrio bacteriovorus]